MYEAVEVQFHTFLTLELDRTESTSRRDLFISDTRVASTHCIEGWVGPRADQDAVKNRENIPPPGNWIPLLR
jgi:hypothetical protein